MKKLKKENNGDEYCSIIDCYDMCLRLKIHLTMQDVHIVSLKRENFQKILQNIFPTEYITLTVSEIKFFMKRRCLKGAVNPMYRLTFPTHKFNILC